MYVQYIFKLEDNLYPILVCTFLKSSGFFPCFAISLVFCLVFGSVKLTTKPQKIGHSLFGVDLDFT